MNMYEVETETIANSFWFGLDLGGVLSGFGGFFWGGGWGELAEGEGVEYGDRRTLVAGGVVEARCVNIFFLRKCARCAELSFPACLLPPRAIISPRPAVRTNRSCEALCVKLRRASPSLFKPAKVEHHAESW